MNCIFCEIVKGTIPSYTIYEDEVVKAFLDIHPNQNGHTLIIPKKHTLDAFTIDCETLEHILTVSEILSKRMESRLGADGITFVQNNGCSQEVKHFHLHLEPCYLETQELLPIETIYQKLKEDYEVNPE